ncbi:MAG: BMC domain-containing protein [Lachnospiraceae bacterium]|nr:BMC domain-containing protein [Lachnospiraceae bacterium]
MGDRMTKEELLDKIFSEHYRPKAGESLRMVRVRVPGREISLAHIIGVSQTSVYQNLGLHIGVHEGEDHTGDTIGLLCFTPWESVVAAADIAVKSGAVDIGFMDRFCGTLILTGAHAEVRSAVEAIVEYFRKELGFTVCSVSEK